MHTANKLFILFIFFCIAIVQSQISYESAFPDLNFNFPVEIQSSVDGSDRLFVVEQPGIIKVFPNTSTIGNSDVSTFLDITTKVAYSSGQEIGLLGLTFHPKFIENGYVFVYYIDKPSNYRVNVVRYTISDTNANILNPSSEFVIARFTKNQSNSNHNGGKIAFGPDGYLYISIGDGGGGGDPKKNAQNLDIAFGSILRIDVDLDGNNPVEINPDLPNGNYEIPSDNPRFGQNGLDELYAWGIRNTWKFSFDASTDRLWGADVGQDGYEEINLIERGGNYGWNRFEANSDEDSSTNLVSQPDIKPLYHYDHSSGDVSITGGYVYRGSSNDSSIQGKYIFGDYVSGRVWSLDYNSSNNSATSELLFRTNGQFISSFGLDESGEIYFSDYGSSAKIYKISEESTEPQTIAVNGVGNWSDLGNGTNGTVETVASGENGDVYVGGKFTNAGGISANNIAIYNKDSGWRSIGTGANGKVNHISIAADGKIYVGGNFSTINGVSVSNIAVWNGSIWEGLGSGTNGPVDKIGIDGNNVYVGGAFETVGNITVNNIALWFNNSWSALIDTSNDVPGTNNEVRAIAFDENSNLYVGGNFDSAGGNSAARIATWNGTKWGTLGSGTSGFVQAIEITPNSIYVGGNFSIAGGLTANRIARWDRNLQNWHTLGNGLSGNVRALKFQNPYLYVGGNFETASDILNTNLIMNNIARWSILEKWQALGPGTEVGVETQVNDLYLSNNNSLIVGGNFSKAGGISTSNIALWSVTNNCSPDDIIPTYQINGNWQNGENKLTIEEGTSLAFSVLSNPEGLVITLPNGAKVSNNYSFSSVSISDSGTYIFTNTEGCSEGLILTVSPIIEDEDGDGVNDTNDQCPGTPINILVDTNGCSLITLPIENFKIQSIGVSCIDADDGRINLQSNITAQFTVNLIGNSINRLLDFNNSLEVNGLSAGTYDLCITTNQIPAYEKCYKIIIQQPKELEVTSFLNENDNSVTLKMSGGKNYSVTINGKPSPAKNSEVVAGLKEGVNFIEISTELNCQGVHKETIVLADNYIAYPNPFNHELNINLDAVIEKKIKVVFYSGLGKLVYSNTYEVRSKTINIDTTFLANGFYFVQITTDSSTSILKLIKT